MAHVLCDVQKVIHIGGNAALVHHKDVVQVGEVRDGQALKHEVKKAKLDLGVSHTLADSRKCRPDVLVEVVVHRAVAGSFDLQMHNFGFHILG